MPRKSDLQQLIANKSRLLQKLKEREALHGQGVEPKILLEIEDLETEIARLQAELATATDDESLPSPSQPALPAASPQIGGVNLSNISGASVAINGDLTANTQAGGDITGGDKRVINTGGGAYIEGQVHTGGGDFIGRDKITTGGITPTDIAHLLEPIYTRVEQANLSPDDKADLKSELQDIQAALAGKAEADETFLTRRLRAIKRLSPDILNLVLSTLANPAAGFSSAVIRIARQMKETAGNER